MSINGAELHFVDHGSGEPVVFVHGTLGDYRTWKSQVGLFSSRFRVITYSRRFHFPNADAEPGSEYSVEQHGEDLARLVIALGLKSVHLVTASWGGNAGLYVAVKHPSLVRSLVLAEPPTFAFLVRHPEGSRCLDKFELDSLFPARTALLDERWEDGVRSFIDGVMGKGAYNRIPGNARKPLMENARELKAELTSARYMYPFTPGEIGSISIPVLLLTAQLSPRWFHLIVDELERCLSHKERAMISSASHGMHAQNPEDYNNVVLSFLARHTTP